MGAVALLLLIVLSAGSLIFRPEGGSSALYYSFQRAVDTDPAHARLYARMYMMTSELTDGDRTHYVVHRAAAAVARLAGRDDAARVQDGRAAQHQPLVRP